MPIPSMPPPRSRRSRRTVVFLISLTLAWAAGVVPVTGSLPASASTELVFLATADAYIRLKAPTRSFGTAADLRVRGGSDPYRALVMFNVTGVTGTVLSARLRLNVSDASPDGGRVYSVGTAWSEATVTWNSAPQPAGSAVASLGAVGTTSVAEVAVTSAIGADRTYAFLIAGDSTNSAFYRSRESGAPPTLVVEVEDAGSTPSPSPIPSTSPSASASAPASSPSGAPSAPPSASPSASASGSAPPAIATFVASADAHVRSGSANTNYGSATTLRLRSDVDAYRSFIRFEVAGLTANVARARLRLWVTDASPVGGSVHPVASSWGETSITWANAPALGTPPIQSVGSTTVGTWVEFDLGGTVSGNGTYSFGLSTTSTNSAIYASREGTAPPELVLDLSAGPPPSASPSPTPSASPSPTPSASPSPTPSASPSPTPSASPSPTPSASPSPTPSASPSPDPITERFLAAADAYVWGGNATRNYGLISTLRVNNDGTQSYRTYLRFDVQGLTGDVTNARLRLFVTDPSPVGGSVHSASTSWTETSVTWSTAPAFGAALDTAGAATAGQWIELNVTSAVTGNGAYHFALTSTSTNSAIFSSREGGQPPELLVTRAGGQAEPIPVASFIATPVSGTAPLAVDFTDTSTGPASAWAWDFDNDGTVDSTAERPIHIYREPGQYSVRLTVSNTSGADTVVRDSLVTVAPGPIASPDDAVMIGAGDIAGCNVLGDEATAALIDGIPGTVFTTGDNVYEDGTAEEFAACYHPSWGRHLARTRPTIGNHEYRSPNAAPYFDYFGAAAGQPGEGWYSYDLGGWHVVVLNSNCAEVGGCSAGSAQDTWLQADLAGSDASCTVALWHHPRFSSGHHGNETDMTYFWSVLEAEGTELALVGHDHDYERFAPQTAAGAPSSTGIREIVVGTGGRSVSPLLAPKPNSEVRDSSTAGVLKVTLHAAGYTWEFLPATMGGFVDAGSDTCH